MRPCVRMVTTVTDHDLRACRRAFFAVSRMVYASTLRRGRAASPGRHRPRPASCQAANATAGAAHFDRSGVMAKVSGGLVGRCHRPRGPPVCCRLARRCNAAAGTDSATIRIGTPRKAGCYPYRRCQLRPGESGNFRRGTCILGNPKVARSPAARWSDPALRCAEIYLAALSTTKIGAIQSDVASMQSDVSQIQGDVSSIHLSSIESRTP
jgi:hypothetical protein